MMRTLLPVSVRCCPGNALLPAVAGETHPSTGGASSNTSGSRIYSFQMIALCLNCFQLLQYNFQECPVLPELQGTCKRYICMLAPLMLTLPLLPHTSGGCSNSAEMLVHMQHLAGSAVTHPAANSGACTAEQRNSRSRSATYSATGSRLPL